MKKLNESQVVEVSNFINVSPKRNYTIFICLSAFLFLTLNVFCQVPVSKLKLPHNVDYDATTTTTTGNRPSSIAIGDVNGDGFNDYVVSHSNDGAQEIALRFGNGDGTFSEPVEINVGGRITDIALVDMNFDGILDIVAANSDSKSITVLVGKGDGTFLTPVNFTPGEGITPTKFVVTDFNYDSINDIATINNNNTVTIFMGQYDGTLINVDSYAVGNNPSFIIACSLNGDWKKDLAIANYDDNSVSILLGYGDGTFTPPQTFNAGSGSNPVSLGAVDVDKDGDLDLLVAKEVGDTITILLNNKFGGFNLSTKTISTTSPKFILVADFDYDKKQDFVVTDTTGSVVTFFQSIGNYFATGVSSDAGSTPVAIAVGDLNGDDVIDVLVANQDSSDVSVLINETPVALPTSARGFEDNDISVTLNTTDLIGLTYNITKDPVHGTLSGSAPNLIYTPDPDYFGSDSFKYNVSDGEITSVEAIANIVVVPVNDAPSFTLINDKVTVLEDVPQQIINNFARDILKGALNEKGQGLRFILENNNPSLFRIQPYMTVLGRLVFMPAKDAFGTATIRVTLKDTGGTANDGVDEATGEFTIDVLPVNDMPTIKLGRSLTVNEDCGLQTFEGWATGITPGPANESDQSVEIILSTDNENLFATLPSINPIDGTLTFEPAANSNGYANVFVYVQDDGGIDNGGKDRTPIKTFRITVRAVNDPPSFDIVKDLIELPKIDTNLKEYQIIKNISPGPGDEYKQTVTFQVLNNTNMTMFYNQPRVSPQGILSFKGRGIAREVNLIIKAVDSGGVAYGGKNVYTNEIPVTIRFTEQ